MNGNLIELNIIIHNHKIRYSTDFKLVQRSCGNVNLTVQSMSILIIFSLQPHQDCMDNYIT